MRFQWLVIVLLLFFGMCLLLLCVLLVYSTCQQLKLVNCHLFPLTGKEEARLKLLEAIESRNFEQLRQGSERVFLHGRALKLLKTSWDKLQDSPGKSRVHEDDGERCE